MIMQHSKRAGFTLMELLIAIAIVAILAAIAVPTYLSYTRKAYYAEILQTADQYKTAVSACLDNNSGDETKCGAGQNGIPDNVTSGVGQVSAVEVANAVITVRPADANGIKPSDTYILTPSYTDNGITWKASGGSCNKGLAPNCSS